MPLAEYMSSYESIDFTSRPIAQAVDNAERTLLQVLQGILPDCFACSTRGKQDQPDETSKASVGDNISADSATVGTPSTPNAQLEEHNFLTNYLVLVCGIRPSLQTPLAGLHNVLHAPDLFLYISVIALP